MIAAVVAQQGRLDILVNNAGIFDLAPIVEITRESYHRLFAVNVEGLLFTLQAAARQMIAQGHGGKIINFASQAGAAGRSAGGGLLRVQGGGHQPDAERRSGPDQARHQRQCDRARRGGQRTLGPRRFIICPLRESAAGRKEAACRRVSAVRRMARPDEIGGLATFLASADADYIVAQTYNIDGGNWMS